MHKKPFGYHLLFAFLKLHALLPLKVLYIFSDILYFITYYVVRYRRKMVRRNLTNSFPKKTNSEIIKIEKEFYSHFTDYFFETIKLLHISNREMDKRMKFTNLDVLQNAMKDNKSCIMYLGHYGNWEWVPSIGLHISKEIVTGQIYQRISNKSFDEIFIKIRTRFKSLNIERKETMRRIVQLRNDGEQMLLGFIADQRPPRYYDTYWTTFLNQDTLTLTGSERIARKMKFSVIYLDIQKLRRGYYSASFSLLSEDANKEPEFAITEKYMRKFEATILKQPAYYLWTHNRWKFSRTTTSN